MLVGMADTAMSASAPAAAAPTGLPAGEAARRLAARGPVEQGRSSRSYASIVRANVFTVFNLILAVFGGLMLAFGSWQDALFLGVLVSNATIGIVQEVRAKRALDRLRDLLFVPAVDADPRPHGAESMPDRPGGPCAEESGRDDHRPHGCGGR